MSFPGTTRQKIPVITKFLHTGFEVNNLDEAIKSYEELGFKLTKRFEKPEPKAYFAQMSSLDGSGIELWQFIDTEHRQHIAVSSDDFEKDIEELVKKGFEIVIPITKGVVLTYAFLRDPSNNYIEVAKQ
jgi:catechol 2,3-dioxygenase-like lactoylglutathione lyase family enzyme